MPRPSIASERIRRTLIFSALGVLAILLYLTVYHFVVALTWAAILVLTCWPLFRKLQERWPNRQAAVAFFTTTILGLLIVVPLGFLAVLLVREAQELGVSLANLLVGKEGSLAEEARTLPVVGEKLYEFLNWLREDPNRNVAAFIDDYRTQLLATGRNLLTRITENLFSFFVCMFATYFLFRHGIQLGQQIARGVQRLGGDRAQGLMRHIQETVKAVVYGLVMTAIAQAIVAAFGFWLFGVPFPLLLGIMMFFISFIPFGPPLIWIPASLILLSRRSYADAVLMFLYGAAIISMMDNVFRPLFIGQATRMSVLLVFIGVLGGILSFGMVGLFVGPVVIAVALALWRDWVESRPGGEAASGTPVIEPPGRTEKVT